MEKRTTPGKTTESYSLKIEGLLGSFRSERVRWLMSKENEMKRNSGMSDEAFKQLIMGVARQEADRSMIISQLRINNERTVGELAAATHIPQKQIIKEMIALMKRGSVAVAGEKGGEYVFAAIEPPE